ncbi:hypothetical protein BDV10DRAFT_46313 [Aspergillus recurvatus]
MNSVSDGEFKAQCGRKKKPCGWARYENNHILGLDNNARTVSRGLHDLGNKGCQHTKQPSTYSTFLACNKLSLQTPTLPSLGRLSRSTSSLKRPDEEVRRKGQERKPVAEGSHQSQFNLISFLVEVLPRSQLRKALKTPSQSWVNFPPLPPRASLRGCESQRADRRRSSGVSLLFDICRPNQPKEFADCENSGTLSHWLSMHRSGVPRT